jgi:hypothetical protein
MEQVRIRACTLDDIDGVIALERQWEQEASAYGDFQPPEPRGICYHPGALS